MTRHKKYCITNLCGIVVYYVNSLNLMLVLTYSYSAHCSCRHGGLSKTVGRKEIVQQRNDTVGALPYVHPLIEQVINLDARVVMTMLYIYYFQIMPT